MIWAGTHTLQASFAQAGPINMDVPVMEKLRLPKDSLRTRFYAPPAGLAQVRIKMNIRRFSVARKGEMGLQHKSFSLSPASAAPKNEFW